MGYDKTLEFSRAQEIAGTGLLFSEKHIDLQALREGTAGSGLDLGEGGDLWLAVKIDESCEGGDGLEAQLVASTTFPGDSTEIVLVSTGQQPRLHPALATPGPLVANESMCVGVGRVDRNQKVPMQAPPGPYFYQFPASYRFVSVRYIRYGTFTLGKVSAWLCDRQPAIGRKQYPIGVPGNSTPGVN